MQIANATKDKFFSIIAHDLKNPFNMIIGFSELAINKIKTKDYEKGLKFTTIINESSVKAYELLENLLTWSRSQSGSIKFNPETCDIKPLIDSTILFLKNAAEEKGISLYSNITKGINVYIDKNMILTILRNLITNAIKFSRKNDSITIEAEETNSSLIIHVIDTGIGIDENTIIKLFKIGENIKTDGTNKEPGTGLGLLLCKEFVEWHNGQIWIKSTVGKGTTISFSIPMQQN